MNPSEIMYRGLKKSTITILSFEWLEKINWDLVW